MDSNTVRVGDFSPGPLAQLSTVLFTKRTLVQFPVGAHARVAGLMPSLTSMFLSKINKNIF